MDGIVLFLGILFSVVAHPVRILKDIYKLGTWFLWGDSVLTKESTHESLYPQYVKYHQDLQKCWDIATPEQRRRDLVPLGKAFAQRCREFNQTLPPGSPYRLHF